MINKKMRILVFAAALLMTMSFLFGCVKPEDDDNPSPTSTPSPGEGIIIPNTDFKLVSAGKTDYKIVISAQAEYEENYGAQELAAFFEEAIGTKPQIIEDTGLTFSQSDKHISVGNTTLLQGAGVDVSDLTPQSFKVVTKGQSVIIAGGDALGSLYGSYEFLHYVFGFEVYSVDEIALEKNVKEKLLPNFNLSSGPDIMLRIPNYGKISYNIVAATRMRLNKNAWMVENANFVHNTFGEYFPKKTYQGTHPEFYAVDASGNFIEQLCYSARGDEDELALMQELTVARMKHLINRYFSSGQFLESISFTHEDNGVWCQCDDCKASRSHYGTDAAVLIHFINPVAREVKEWLSQAWPGRNVNIVIFAYTRTELAPVVTNSDGSYSPVDESVILEDNVAIFYAPYYADYFYDFNESINIPYRVTLEKWKVLTDKLYLWTYSTGFHNYVAWYDSFNSMQSIYRMAKEMNAYYMFDQARYNVTGASGFDSLKMYLNAKLYWNVDADVPQLTQNFFENFFKDAWQPMRAYFDDYRLWMEHLRTRQDSNKIGGTMQNTSPYSSDHLPFNKLRQWEALINQAYEAIEPLKTSNPGLYTTLYDRICSESIAVRFFLIDLYGSTEYTPEEALEMKLAFKYDADRLDFTRFTESKPLSTIYEKWKI